MLPNPISSFLDKFGLDIVPVKKIIFVKIKLTLVRLVKLWALSCWVKSIAPSAPSAQILQVTLKIIYHKY